MATGLPAFNTVTASAAIIPARRVYDPEYTNEQDQLWDYYQRLEEFSAAVNWKANAISRVRLTAAEFLPGGDEPTPITEGPIADAVARLAGGIGGQSQVVGEMATHLNVPGEGWLVGSTNEFDEEDWKVYSADELRVRQGRYQIRYGSGSRAWQDLGTDVVVVRFWRPHPRWGWRATSRAAYALGAMKELDLINRRIIAETVSRMAANGLIIYDRDKLSFPNLSSPQGVSSEDPFASMLVDVGAKGIKDPTSAEATIKIPIGASLGDLDSVKISDLIHVIDLSNPFSERMLDQRLAAVTRLATALDIPTEQLTGMGGLNHWGAAQIEEHGIKIHVAPDMETICHSLTEGYLYPTLRAEGRELRGPEGGRAVVWYDPSEITQRPDRSPSATRAYDRLELSGAAYVRELGFAETDRPDEEELAEMERLLEIRAKYGATPRRAPDDAEASSDIDKEPSTEVDDVSPDMQRDRM